MRQMAPTRTSPCARRARTTLSDEDATSPGQFLDREQQVRILPGVLSPLCCSCRMTEVASRELRNNTRRLLERVEAGEDVTITVNGRPVAVLRPAGSPTRWVSRQAFAARVLGRQADAGLARDLDELAPDTTDDLSS